MLLKTSVVAFVLLTATVAHADSFRCPNGSLVSTGDSISEVSLKCDAPTSVVRRDDPVETAWGKTAYVEVQEWTYNQGPNQFVYFLVFRGGRLVAVRSGDYGR
ncbi:MAG: DUF2845 domain-containing protein [Geobacteraceae bacterium]|nr:DUF2845 domain-containing protein [Geobacteraceae bacterium]